MPSNAPSPEARDNLTPMLRQYREIKEKYPDCILFYRIGDFYEMFFEDAVAASKALDIVLTSRNKNDPNPVPLCGVPYHSVQPYLEKLIEKGFKVAICDQAEDPKEAKGVVRREVTRVVTPGMTGYLQSEEKGTNYLAAIQIGKEKYGIAFLEIATGDFRVSEIPAETTLLREELERIRPREILLPEKDRQRDLGLGNDLCRSFIPDWVWEESYARRILYQQFGVSTLSGFGCEGIPEGVIAAGAALHYSKETQKVDRLPHLTALKAMERLGRMILGEETRTNLSLDDLILLVDQTKTAMGGRKLREWFHSPLVSKKGIEARLDAVEEIRGHAILLEGIQKKLETVYDLERINGRLSLGTANGRDLKGLVESLLSLTQISPLLQEFKSENLKNISSAWDPVPEIREEIERIIVDSPPLSLREGGLIREGVNSELDELRLLSLDAKGAIAGIEERERKRTGIGSLKVHFNRVFGYYLEVSTAHLSKVPPDFIRKQTLTNAERYITPELKKFEDKILGADERIKRIEYEVFAELRQKVLQAVPRLQEQAGRVASLDVLLNLASYAKENRTARPEIEEGGVLEIRGGRHPLVEKTLPAGSFVPNDLFMDVEKDRLLMITGPNMAGKSTMIRQAGVIVLMAQAGSFVPAESARIGIVDRIFTRVGASDRLARGESTFMVEMCETAAILHQATDRSLILLDEIGRGTSTFDGLSIAWAVAEHLHDKVHARTLFATHYHELTDLALTRPGIKNYNVAVKEEGEGIVFLYRLVPGGASHSYGIHVAKLAGLPPEVLDRAREVLKNLESTELDPEGSPRLGKKIKKDNRQLSIL